MSSATPSEKYSCSGSLVMFMKRNTAIDGLLGGDLMFVVLLCSSRCSRVFVGSKPRANVSTGCAMFFRLSTPILSNTRSGRFSK